MWRSFSGAFQWRLLWLLNAKFNLGVSAVVVDKAANVLLLRHSFRRSDGWSLPSGWMAAGERIGDAIVREIREETRLEVEPVTIFRIESGFRLRVGFFLLCRTTAAPADIVVDGKEVLEARFFAPASLPEIVPVSDRSAIAEALALRQNDHQPIL